MTRKTRPVSWIGAALKEFETFPEGARSICMRFKNKSTQGTKTPKRELDVIKQRLKRLKDLLQ
jgi:phage-related protein